MYGGSLWGWLKEKYFGSEIFLDIQTDLQTLKDNTKKKVNTTWKSRKMKIKLAISGKIKFKNIYTKKCVTD